MSQTNKLPQREPRATGERDIPAQVVHASLSSAGRGFRAIHEPEHDSVYFFLDDAAIDPERSRALDSERTIDYAADGTPVGVEFRHVSAGVVLEGVPDAERINAELRRIGVPIREAAQAR